MSVFVCLGLSLSLFCISVRVRESGGVLLSVHVSVCLGQCVCLTVCMSAFKFMGLFVFESLCVSLCLCLSSCLGFNV